MHIAWQLACSRSDLSVSTVLILTYARRSTRIVCGMATIELVVEGEGAGEAPFTAEQVQWMDQLVATCHVSRQRVCRTDRRTDQKNGITVFWYRIGTVKKRSRNGIGMHRKTIVVRERNVNFLLTAAVARLSIMIKHVIFS